MVLPRLGTVARSTVAERHAPALLQEFNSTAISHSFLQLQMGELHAALLQIGYEFFRLIMKCSNCFRRAGFARDGP